MISLIICSRKALISAELERNIKATIGVEYETIVIDNSANNYSIFEAYNLGVEKSKHPLLCFMHDDIIYHTKNWGKKVLQYFEDEATGAIGIAGSPYAPKMPGSWWSGGLINEYIMPDTTYKPSLKYYRGNGLDKNRVVTLDGVWMCIKASLFKTIKFDETRFKGYHFYDVDISLQVNKLGYKLFVVFDILIQHFSSATINLLWVKNARSLQAKWRTELPVSCVDLSYNQKCSAELKTLNEYIDFLLINNTAKRTVLKVIVKELGKYRKGLFYYKTPFYLYKYLDKIVRH